MRRRGLVLIVSAVALMASGCDEVLFARYGMPVAMPSVAEAPRESAACTAQQVGTGAVDARGVVLTCVASGAAGRWVARPQRPNLKPLVLVYGDSLAFESQRQVRAALPAEFDVVFRVYGGTAPCDWVPSVVRDVRVYRPAVVITSFLGNSLTSCTGHARGEALAANYRIALAALANAALARNAVVVMVSEPPTVSQSDDVEAVARVTWSTARAFAAAGKAVYASDAGVVLTDPASPAGVRIGVARMICLSGEAAICSGGWVRVRNPDGVHLCPVAPASDGLCPVRAAGAERFGAALARTARAAYARAATPYPAPMPPPA